MRNDDHARTLAQQSPAQHSLAERQAARERFANWRVHCMVGPTFTDLTNGICIGLVWTVLLWTPMFISALT